MTWEEVRAYKLISNAISYKLGQLLMARPDNHTSAAESAWRLQAIRELSQLAIEYAAIVGAGESELYQAMRGKFEKIK